MNKEIKPEDFIMMPIPANSYAAVCAVLCGAVNLTVAQPGKSQPGPSTAIDTAKSDTAPGSDGNETSAPENQASDGRGLTVTKDASPSDNADNGEVDAHGHPWSADLHASTKGKTKDGLWRMKVGVSRPDPLPGFPVESGADTGTSSATDTTSATSQGATGAASAPAGTDEDDEFAAFRNAAAASDATDQAAAAAVPERTYSDADLGALCNQAAVKLGDPSPIKEIIASYTPEGQVAHSRNIPADKRAEFVKAVEAKAGIEFAG